MVINKLTYKAKISNSTHQVRKLICVCGVRWSGMVGVEGANRTIIQSMRYLSNFV